MRTCSSKGQFESNITDFKIRLINRGYPETLITNTLAEINFDNRNVALKQEPKARTKMLRFVTKFNPTVPNIKSIIKKNWYLTQNQPELNNAIFPKAPNHCLQKAQSQRLARKSKIAKLVLLKKQTNSNSGHKTLITIMSKVVQADHPLTPQI